MILNLIAIWFLLNALIFVWMIPPIDEPSRRLA
jgi:hypothetical protein